MTPLQPSEEMREKAREIIDDKIFEIVSMAANLGMNNPLARAEIARVGTDNLQHRITQALLQERERTLEEAAKEAEKYVMKFIICGVEVTPTLDTNNTPQVPEQISTAIRNLKREGESK